jgi:hypothetical protein
LAASGSGAGLRDRRGILNHTLNLSFIHVYH